MILNDLLKPFGLGGLSEEEIQHLNHVWHRLTPWPDSVPGLNRLRGRYVLATLSNGNLSLPRRHGEGTRDCPGIAALRGALRPLQARPRGVPGRPRACSACRRAR